MYSITRVSEDKISCDFLQVERGSTRSSRNSTGGLNKILPKKTVDIGLTEGARGRLSFQVIGGLIKVCKNIN